MTSHVVRMEEDRSAFKILAGKGPFINYVRVPREEGGLEKSLHTLTLDGGENPFLCNIFQVDILY